MQIRLMRKGREIKLGKRCPTCNSSRFKPLELPRRAIYGFPMIIVAECPVCEYKLAFPEEEVKQ